MMDSRSSLIIYKQQEKELTDQIERLRAARERGAYEESPSWLSVAGQWLKNKLAASENMVVRGHHSPA